MVPRSPFQLALEMWPCTPVKDQETATFLKYVKMRKIAESRWESIESGGKTGTCVEEVVRGMCLRWRMKQTSSETVRV